MALTSTPTRRTCAAGGALTLAGTAFAVDNTVVARKDCGLATRPSIRPPSSSTTSTTASESAPRLPLDHLMLRGARLSTISRDLPSTSGARMAALTVQTSIRSGARAKHFSDGWYGSARSHRR